METPRQYDSVEKHFKTKPEYGNRNNLSSKIRESQEEVSEHTIVGESIDERLKGYNISVEVAKIEMPRMEWMEPEYKIAAVTSFETGPEASDAQRNITNCYNAIQNRIFYLNPIGYDEADIIEILQNEISNEEATN